MDYKNGKIYRLICESGKQYIGSTTQPLRKRLFAHKKPSSTITNFINPIIILIEDYPCERKEQLLMRERYWIENTECVNKNRPIINKEELLEWRRQHYQKTKHTKPPSIKNKKMMTCECGRSFQICYKAEHLKTKKHQKFIQAL